MKEIPLTQGKVAIVDDENYEWLSQWKWYVVFDGSNWYAARTEGRKPNRKTIKMHRVIMNAPDGMQVDHINHDTLNNQAYNLRLCTTAQNLQNGRKHRDNTSGYKGVRANGRKFEARIRLNGSLIYLGLWDTPEQAARIYDDKARELFGEFARLNFGEEGK